MGSFGVPYINSSGKLNMCSRSDIQPLRKKKEDAIILYMGKKERRLITGTTHLLFQVSFSLASRKERARNANTQTMLIRPLASGDVQPPSASFSNEKYSAKEYFLALFLVVGFIVLLRLALYVAYRSCYSRPPNGMSFSLASVENNHEVPVLVSDEDDRRSIFVILAGEERTRFIAQRASLSDFRNPLKLDVRIWSVA